jgi:hypothetical protein
VLGGGGRVQAMRDEYAKALSIAEREPDNKTRENMMDELRPLQLAAGYFLPPNFMAAVAAWCECLDAVNIKQLRPEELITAYEMSRHYHNRASDNIPGVFLEHTRKEIDILAANLYHEKKQGRK